MNPPTISLLVFLMFGVVGGSFASYTVVVHNSGSGSVNFQIYHGPTGAENSYALGGGSGFLTAGQETTKTGGYDGAGWGIKVWCDGSPAWSDAQPEVDGGTTHFYINAPPADNYCWACFDYTNPCPEAATVYIVEAGPSGSRNDGAISILAGQSLHLCATNTTASGWCPFQLQGLALTTCRDPQNLTADSASAYLAGGVGGSGTSGSPTGGNDMITNRSVYTGPGGTNLATKADINAILNELSIGFGLLDGDLKSIGSDLLYVAKESTQRGATNLLGQILSRFSADGSAQTNLLNQIVEQLRTNSAPPGAIFTNMATSLGVSTNLLGQILSALGTNPPVADSPILTNMASSLAYLSNNVWAKSAYASNLLFDYVSIIPGTATNAADATNKMMELLSDEMVSIDLAVSNITHAPAAGMLGGGSSSIFEFDFCGQRVSVDPEVRFPGMMALIKLCWTLILSAIFAVSVGRLMFEAACTYAQAEGGGVPDVEFEISFTIPILNIPITIGSNVIGMIIAIAVPLALVAVWKLVWSYVLGYSLSQYLHVDVSMLDFSAFNYAGAGVGYGALYLLNASFPIALFFALVTTRLAMHFLAAKVVVIAGGAAKFFWTK